MSQDAHSEAGSPAYRAPSSIDPSELRNALRALTVLGDDVYMGMQAANLSTVDPFIMNLEAEVLEKWLVNERTPVPEAMFLSAQSQMWIFAAYELMRTWEQRCRDIINWHENGGLELKAAALEANLGYPHPARQMRADQLRTIIDDKSIVDRIKLDLRRAHIPFTRLEALRVAIAKHEVSGRPNAVALQPGYGRINIWCGSLDYELENGRYSMGFISRRDIAEELRALSDAESPPDENTLKEFDDYMRGKTDLGQSSGT